MLVIVYYFNISFRKYYRLVVRTHLQCFRRTRHSSRACTSFPRKKIVFRRVTWCASMSCLSRCGACPVTMDGKALMADFMFVLPFLSPAACKYDPILAVLAMFILITILLISVLLFFLNIVFYWLQLCPSIETDYICWFSIQSLFF